MMGASVATASPDNGEIYGTDGAEVAGDPHAEANKSMNNKPARARRFVNILFSFESVSENNGKTGGRRPAIFTGQVTSCASSFPKRGCQCYFSKDVPFAGKVPSQNCGLYF
jgi:hypothetical protein